MPTNRRRFILQTTAGALTGLASSAALATETHLAEDEPIAVALGYKIDATQVDTATYPKRAGAQGAQQFCRNCSLYRDRGNDVGTCSAIPGKLVAGPGWCNAWVPKL